MSLPEVTVFSLGGTISSTKGKRSTGVVSNLTGEDLISAVPELSEVANVSAASFRQVAGSELTMDDVVELAADIERRIDSGASGIVVTQGTNTIEETVFVLDVLVDREAPVVVTGAMRNPTLPGADGPANLLAAVQVAASDLARNLGAVVVFNDEVHAARYVQKTHTQSPAAFRSPSTGPIGWVAEGAPRIVLRPVNRHRVAPTTDAPDRRVALLTATLGDDGGLLAGVKQGGYAGLVIEAFGGGQVPSIMVDELSSLAAEMPVVVASRTGSGEALRRTYGFPGSEIDLLGRGLISAGLLDGPKARLFLALLLRAGASSDEIADRFDGWLDG
jgi:L-asparaginase